MELRQLEYFVAVAEEANFTRAAERIHVAQPAVSAQIQRLERELGQPLLDRSRRTVRLTGAGEAALPYARAALAAVADIHVAVEELTQLVRGTVTIGTVTSHSVDIAASARRLSRRPSERRNHAQHRQFRRAHRQRAHRAAGRGDRLRRSRRTPRGP